MAEAKKRFVAMEARGFHGPMREKLAVIAVMVDPAHVIQVEEHREFAGYVSVYLDNSYASFVTAGTVEGVMRRLGIGVRE